MWFFSREAEASGRVKPLNTKEDIFCVVVVGRVFLFYQFRVLLVCTPILLLQPKKPFVAFKNTEQFFLLVLDTVPVYIVTIGHVPMPGVFADGIAVIHRTGGHQRANRQSSQGRADLFFWPDYLAHNSPWWCHRFFLTSWEQYQPETNQASLSMQIIFRHFTESPELICFIIVQDTQHIHWDKSRL